MATRSELYQQFGPQLLDAFAQVLLSEINLIRTEVGMAERDGGQLVNAIDAKLKTLAKYDWMHD